ncbi:MAG TPA: homoserine dehydrogenase [Candidatus Bathyarchaeota archaeon]|nr:homoserine dehydrogenase [Candidatus Bathyarchaeota archaeon]
MRLILIGFGFIGKEFAKVLRDKMSTLKEIDKDFKIVGVADSKGYIYNDNGVNLEKLSSISKLSEYQSYKSGESALKLIDEDLCDVIVEATPTNIKDGEPGLTHIRRALSRGIHVVTPNKGPLVLAFRELTNLAEKNGCSLLYEGTVDGAIPIFSLVRECLRGDEIIRLAGILNGTTNYILSKMFFEETSFEIALKEAQERGLTERDPSYDVDGIDAACKIVILANALMGREAKFEDVERVGIRGITQEAISLAKKSNYAIKLIGTIDKRLEVAPKLVPINHPLCVHGTLNAIHIETDLAKEITLVGYGAGKETVSAVLNDLITVLKRNMGIKN